MTVVLEQTEPDPQQVIADLEHRLVESNAERRSFSAATRQRRGVAGHQFLARRPCPGVRHDAGKDAMALRGVGRRHQLL
jgi:hypothetical protein